eukprot:3248798-Alexandrium_andersonii.AAC.1
MPERARLATASSAESLRGELPESRPRAYREPPESLLTGVQDSQFSRLDRFCKPLARKGRDGASKKTASPSSQCFCLLSHAP